MIRWFFRWILRAVLLLALVFLALLIPVAYVEFTCKGTGVPQPYASLLPPEDRRAEARTLLTYPEWHIVHAYDDYAQVIKEGDPHDFSYFDAVNTYWTSLCALKERSAVHGGMDVETSQLVYVIGVSFTAEMVLKAAYEETLGRVATLIRGPEHSPLDTLSAEQAAAYAAFLQQTPWYKWDFAADSAALGAARTDVFRDYERRYALGAEYAAKSAYGGVIEGAVATVGPDALTLRMIVSGPGTDALATTEGVTVIGTRPEGVEIETPRYRALTDLLTRLSALDLTIVEMAGNDDIMFTAVSSNPSEPNALFSFARQGYGDYRHLFMVKTSDLLRTLRDINAGPLTLEHVHDY